jgi:NAD(P)-dependent dehydrogenase (short-subunit alcohol dehydrogenase family)
MGFEDKVALVTGAAGAIGKGIAADLCACGAKVFITDLHQDGVDAAVADITDAGGTCQGRAGDVVDETQVVAVVAAAREAFGGRIDILVNVAGIVAQGKVEDLTVEEWDRVFAVNCRGTFLFIKHVVPLMKASGYGKIVNFSSKSGKTGSALMCHYSGAKAAVMGMTQALAYELAGARITVNCLCPGITENTGVWDNVSAGYIKNLKMPREEVVKKFTAKVPLGRLAGIADVVAVTRFLASEGADYMTGQAINVTGGREMH